MPLDCGAMPSPSTAEPKRRSMREIAEEVARQHGLTLAELKSPTPAPAVSHPRQEAMCLMMAERFTTGQIKLFFGLKDHTTVLHAKKAVARRAGAA